MLLLYMGISLLQYIHLHRFCELKTCAAMTVVCTGTDYPKICPWHHSWLCGH